MATRRVQLTGCASRQSVVGRVDSQDILMGERGRFDGP